jgi:hypothetical protein
VPGAVLAAVDGKKVKVTTTSTGLAALELGTMMAGQSHQVTVWLDASATGTAVDLGQSILLGSAGHERGRVLLWGDRGWFGADVEALRWARWVIGADLAAVLAFGLASLILPFLTRRQDGPRRAMAQPAKTA